MESHLLSKWRDGVLMMPKLLHKSAHMRFRSVQLLLYVVRHLFCRFNCDVQRDNLQLKIVDLLLFQNLSTHLFQLLFFWTTSQGVTRVKESQSATSAGARAIC